MGALRHLPDTTCEHCRTVFRPRRAEQQFCSRGCWYKKASGSSERVCGVCGKAFKAKYGLQTYCSVACMNTASGTSTHEGRWPPPVLAAPRGIREITWHLGIVAALTFALAV